MKKVKIVLLIFVFFFGLSRIMLGFLEVRASAIDSDNLMKKINEERNNRNIPRLLTDDRLVTAAFAKTVDMIDRDYFDHIDPDGSFVWPRVQTSGYYPYKMLGENLAIDFSTEAGIVKAWLNSPTHRDNMLNSEFADQGLSAQYGDYENRNTSLVTSLFGTLVHSIVHPAAQTEPPAPASSPSNPPRTSVPPSQGTAPSTEIAPEKIYEKEVIEARKESEESKNQPAIQLTAAHEEKKLSTETIQTFVVSFPEKIVKPDINFLETIRKIFIATVFFLFLVIFIDIFWRKKHKKNWIGNPHLPILLIILLTSLLTVRLY